MSRTDSSPRPSKRPRLGSSSASSARSSPPGPVAAGPSRLLAGPDSDLHRDHVLNSADEHAEPSTDNDDDDDDNTGEPSTEEGSEDDGARDAARAGRGEVQGRSRVQRRGQGGSLEEGGAGDAIRSGNGILDLTDEGDNDTGTLPPPVGHGTGGTRTRPQPGDDERLRRRSSAVQLSSDEEGEDEEEEIKVTADDEVIVAEAGPSSVQQGSASHGVLRRRRRGSPQRARSASTAAATRKSASLPPPTFPIVPAADPAPPPPPPRATLANLTCPICFGAPAPLALTSCGHAFCAPCLHAALVAGPALTPPPPPPPPPGRGGGRRGRGGRGGGEGGGVGAGIYRGLARAAGQRPSRGRRAGTDVEFAGSDPDGGGGGGDPELDKHCPVCRTPLYGGWGKSLRGVLLRMAPVRR